MLPLHADSSIANQSIACGLDSGNSRQQNSNIDLTYSLFCWYLFLISSTNLIIIHLCAREQAAMNYETRRHLHFIRLISIRRRRWRSQLSKSTNITVQWTGLWSESTLFLSKNKTFPLKISSPVTGKIIHVQLVSAVSAGVVYFSTLVSFQFQVLQSLFAMIILARANHRKRGRHRKAKLAKRELYWSQGK